MSKKQKYSRFKNYERKIKSPFMIYADFEPILASENNGKQNPDDLIQTNTKNMLFAAMAIN